MRRVVGVATDAARGGILSERLSIRRDLLARLLADVSSAIALCPQSADVAVADEWMFAGGCRPGWRECCGQALGLTD
jgi:hypothetical protein